MEEQDKQIEKEIADGVIPDPSTLDPITGEPLPAAGEMPMEGEEGVEEGIDGAAGMTPTDPAPPEMPKKGEGEI